jgi:hypothetical protein
MLWDDSTIHPNVSDWVQHILQGQETDIEFDEIYSSIFDSIGTPRLELYVNSLYSNFTSKLEELREEVFRSDSITVNFGDLCQTVLSSIRKLSTAFYPAKLADYDIPKLLNSIAEKTLFSDPSPDIVCYWRSFAHSLPGTIDIEITQPHFKTIIDILRGSPNFSIIVDGVEEATDALSLHISSTMIPVDQFSPFCYLGTCYALLENETRLWSYFKDSIIEHRLRQTLLNGLIKSVAQDIFFAPEVSIRFRRAIFDDFREFTVMVPRLKTLFYDAELQQSLAWSAVDYFADTLTEFHFSFLKDDVPRSLAAADVTKIAQTFVDVFEKLELLGEHLFSKASFDINNVHGMLSYKLSEKGFDANQTFAIYIHQCIETMILDRDKQPEQEEQLLRVRRLIPFLPDRNEFISYHYLQMYIRLFRTAGSQYQLEDKAFRIIESFVAPDTRNRYDELLETFQKSEQIQGNWKIAKPGALLSVLMVTENTMKGIGGSLGELKVPEFFFVHAREFETFCQGIFGTPGKLQWLFEENIVVLRLKRDGVYDINITVVFVIACVILALKDLGRTTKGELTQYLGLKSPPRTEAWCRLLTRDALPLLIVTKEGIWFNPEFRPRRQRFTILCPKSAGLRPLRTGNAAPETGGQ